MSIESNLFRNALNNIYNNIYKATKVFQYYPIEICSRLRLGLLNEEMKDSEIGISGDETFNDVVRDFSHLACSHPERLQRRNESNNTSQPPE